MTEGVWMERLATGDPLSAPGIGRELSMELATRWLVLDAFVGGKRRVDVHPLVLSAARFHEACDVAERAAGLVARAADRAAADPDERRRYRFPGDVDRLAAASRAAGDAGSLVRVDLLLGDDGGLRACEVNADCPGGHNEAMGLPRLARAAGYRAGRDPTTATLELVDRLVALSGGAGSPRGIVALLYATGYAEDLQVCALLERLVRERGGRAARMGPTALAAAPGGGLVHRGEPVSVLYRFYPVEHMAGQRNIDAIVDAVASGAVSAMSSFTTAYAQSKLAMARAFVHEGREAARIYPDTVAFDDVAPATLRAERARWVVKRDLSRVGDHVLVGAAMTDDAWAEALDEVVAAEADGDVWIAQRFLTQAPVVTPLGPRWLTLGVYVLDGRACGFFARLAADLTCSHEALVVPVFVDDAREAAA